RARGGGGQRSLRVRARHRAARGRSGGQRGHPDPARSGSALEEVSVASLARRRADRSKNLVGFTINDVYYAVDILRVREIINPLPIGPLPHAPAAVLGVADHRGQVVPVLEVRRRFGLPSVGPSRRTKWIVVELGDRQVGLVVDSVTDVFGAGGDDQ